MSRADFNEYNGANTNHQLVSSPSNEGSTAMQVNNIGNTSAEILAKSETDNPTDWEWEGWNYARDGAGAAFICAFADADNFYSIAFGQDGGSLDTKLWITERNSGTDSVISSQTIKKDGDLLDFNLSDGNAAANRWALIRLHVWVDSSGDLRARLLEDTDGDGTWERYNGVNDVVDTDPFRTSGGLGFGGGLTAPNWIDTTEAYGLDAGSSQDFQFKY